MSAKEPPHIVSLRNQDKLNRRATKRYRVAGGKVEAYIADTSAYNLAAAAEERARAALSETGARDARGIFLGVWEPKDKNGDSLKQKFNVFAAPENLPETLEYDRAVRHIAGLKDWHGHDGADYKNDAELYDALGKGAYNGGWFIPPGELLSGKDISGKPVLSDNLLAHKDKGAFKGTFNKVKSDGVGLPVWYWSSTQHCDDASRVYTVRFYDSYDYHFVKNRCRFSCRPVRLEPAV